MQSLRPVGKNSWSYGVSYSGRSNCDRAEKIIGSAQEASVTISMPQDDREWIDSELMTTICIVSEVTIEPQNAMPSPEVKVERSTHPKCERCWNLRPSVGKSAEHPTLCERCVRVVTEMNAKA